MTAPPTVTVLRVLLAAAPSPQREDPWALFDAQGRLVRSGRGVPAAWPAAERREAVLAAAAVRVASLALPPMPADRLAAAAGFALEDQLAGPASEQHLVAGPRRSDGAVEVAIAARALVGALQRDFARAVAEPALAPRPAAGTWRWYASAGDGGFVRKPDGSAFAVSAATPEAALPAEIALALAQAQRGAAAPRVEVAFACGDEQLAAWSALGGTAFARAAAWRWDQDPAALAAAPDLLAGATGSVGTAPSTARPRALRWAVGLAAAALVLHVAATIGLWSWLRIDAWRTARATVAIAAEAGAGDATDAEAAAAALGRKYTEARQRAGLGVATDALPLLARAAPALAALPPGAFKAATYTPGTWTFELARLDAPAAEQLDRALSGAGLAVLQATTTAGTRLRATLAPGLDLP